MSKDYTGICTPGISMSRKTRGFNRRLRRRGGLTVCRNRGTKGDEGVEYEEGEHEGEIPRHLPDYQPSINRD